MLAAMFAPGSSRAPGILTDGAFFLDRDPKMFEVIFLYIHICNKIMPLHQQIIQALCPCNIYTFTDFFVFHILISRDMW